MTLALIPRHIARFEAVFMGQPRAVDAWPDRLDLVDVSLAGAVGRLVAQIGRPAAEIVVSGRTVYAGRPTGLVRRVAEIIEGPPDWMINRELAATENIARFSPPKEPPWPPSAA